MPSWRLLLGPISSRDPMCPSIKCSVQVHTLSVPTFSWFGFRHHRISDTSKSETPASYNFQFMCLVAEWCRGRYQNKGESMIDLLASFSNYCQCFRGPSLAPVSFSNLHGTELGISFKFRSIDPVAISFSA